MTAQRIFRAHDAAVRPSREEVMAARARAAIRARSSLKSRDLGGSLASLLDPTTAWYRRWYFLLRLDEELEKARRSERPTTLVGVKIPIMGGGLVTDLSDRLRERLARIASETLRPGDFPGCIRDDQLAIYLPATDWLEALPIAEKLGDELQVFAPQLGIAAFPDDGRNALELLMVATEEEPKLATVIELDVWRRKGELHYLL